MRIYMYTRNSLNSNFQKFNRVPTQNFKQQNYRPNCVAEELFETDFDKQNQQSFNSDDCTPKNVFEKIL